MRARGWREARWALWALILLALLVWVVSPLSSGPLRDGGAFVLVGLVAWLWAQWIAPRVH